MSMRAVVVMVSVIRGHGLLAIMTDDLSSHIQEAEALLLQCCHNTKHINIMCEVASETFQVAASQ